MRQWDMRLPQRRRKTSVCDREAPFHSYRGECTYCGHCKPCAANLDIAMINKFYDLATMQPQIPATVQSHYELLEHKASECIGCHLLRSTVPVWSSDRGEDGETRSYLDADITEIENPVSGLSTKEK